MEFSCVGKKGGKKKGQTLNLTEFLGGDGGGSYRPPGSGATTTVSMGSTWAEEMDEEMMERPKQQVENVVSACSLYSRSMVYVLVTHC